MRASMRALGEEAAALAELIAVAGRSLDHHELEALPLATPVEAAADAIRAGLLVEEGDGRVGYRHALLREAVYLDLPEPRRARLHDAIAGVLAGRREAGGQALPAEIAHHLRLAHRDDLAIAELAQAATEAQAVGALAEAVAFLEQAVQLAPGDPALLLALAEAHAWRGQTADAEGLLDRALAALGPADADALLEAHLRSGRWFRGALCDPHRSLEAYRRALALLDAGARPDRRAEALVGAAWCEAVAGDLEAAEALLERADALIAAGTGGDAILSEAAAAHGHALLRRGRFREASEPLLAGGEAALRAGRPDRCYDCWINAATSMACAGDFTGALAIADRALASMRASGFATLELEVLAGRAHILARLGRIAEASDAARAEQELAGRLGDPALRARSDHDAGLIALAAGDHARAEALLAAALDGGAAVGRPRARLARAEALVRLGRLAEAAAELDRDRARADPAQRLPGHARRTPDARRGPSRRRPGGQRAGHPAPRGGDGHVAAGRGRPGRRRAVRGQPRRSRPAPGGGAHRARARAAAGRGRPGGPARPHRLRRLPGMLTFEDSLTTTAPPRTVWKILHDPARFPEWWAGFARVEEDAEGDGEGTRFTAFLDQSLYQDMDPGRPMVHSVRSHAAGDRVVISCLVAEIEFDWRLAPVEGGRGTRIQVAVACRTGGRPASSCNGRSSRRRSGGWRGSPRRPRSRPRDPDRGHPPVERRPISGAGPGHTGETSGGIRGRQWKRRAGRRATSRQEGPIPCPTPTSPICAPSSSTAP